MVWVRMLIVHLSLKKESLSDWKEVPHFSLPMLSRGLYNKGDDSDSNCHLLRIYYVSMTVIKCFTHITSFNLQIWEAGIIINVLQMTNLRLRKVNEPCPKSHRE